MALLNHTLLYTQGLRRAMPSRRWTRRWSTLFDRLIPRLRSLALAFDADHNSATDPLRARRSAVGKAIAICDGLLIRATEAHAASPMPIERGRSLLALGQVQRRRKAKTEARQALQDALDCFTEHGHQPFARLAGAELERGRRAGSDSVLTASEQRVADHRSRRA